MRTAFLAIALAALAACLTLPVLFFHRSIDEAEFRQWLAVASLFWFVFATLFATRSRAA